MRKWTGKIRGVTLIILVFFFLDFNSYAQVLEEKFSLPEYVLGEVIVKYKESFGEAQIQTLIAPLGSGIKIKRKIKPKEDRSVYLLKLPSGLKVLDAVAQLKQDSNVEYAEPNYIYRLLATPPNDTDFNNQWYLHNYGQTVNGFTGTPGADIKAPETWDITTGSAQTVIAIIDTGADLHHPDLQLNLIPGYDFVDNDNQPFDYNGHGTHVAGIIGAKGNNSQFVTGINWTVKIMPLRSGGISGSFTSSRIADAIYYAVDNGAHIINASFGGHNFSQIQYDAWKYASDRSVLCVIAAGNGANNNDADYAYPADFGYAPACSGNPAIANIISVAATDENDIRASYSNFGVHSVHLAAPGGNASWNMFSTYPKITEGTPNSLYFQDFEGDYSEWVQGGSPQNWTVTAGTGAGETKSLEDSPGGNYPNSADTWMMIQNPFPRKKETKLLLNSLYIKGALELGYDFFNVEISPDGISWESLYATSVLPSDFQSLIGDLTLLYDLLDQFYFRFHLTSDVSNTYDGIYIDNMILTETPLSLDTHTDTYLSGTSMAAPIVSGIAGLVKSMRPWFTASDIKNVILFSVDPLTSLSGYVSTGGRANAYKAVTYNNPSSKPSNLSPTGSDVSLTPFLSAFPFSDPDRDSQSQAQWQITTTSGNYSAPAWNHTSSTDLISATVPTSSPLNYSTIYYWRVRYQDNYAGGALWSNWSEQTSFTTQSAPSSGGGDGGGGGGGPVGPLVVGISALLGWWKRRKQR